MTSFQNEKADDDLFVLDPKDEAVSDFVTLVGRQLQDAFLQRRAEEGLTQQQLATKIGVDRSRIHRCLSGYSNLTIESVAELVWALKAKPHFRIELDDGSDRQCNFRQSSHRSVKITYPLKDGISVCPTDMPSAPGTRVSGNKVHVLHENS